MSRAFFKIVAASFLLAASSLAVMAADVSEEILAKAIERYEAGDIQPAIGGINAALRGRLPASLTAKAYYYRGLAHRRAGQPGQAITDLTRAVEQTGLTEAEKANAKETLQVAYQEAGIAPQETVVVTPASAGEAQLRAPSAPPPAQRKLLTPAVITTGATGTVAPERPSASATTQTAQGAWSTSTDEVQRAPPAATPAPVAAARPMAWTKQQIALAPLPPVPKGKKQTGVSADPKPVIPPVARKPEVSAPAASPAPSLAAFVTEVAAAPAATAPTEIRLLVGEPGSRSEAFELAVRLTSQRGAALGPRRPQIAETRFADASFYRVRLGPFSDAGQAMALCRSLSESGYRCNSE